MDPHPDISDRISSLETVLIELTSGTRSAETVVTLVDRGSGNMKALRNACATGPGAQLCVAREGLPVILRILQWAARREEVYDDTGLEAAVASMRRLCWQCIANATAGNQVCQQIIWETVVIEKRGDALEHALVAARSDAGLAGVVTHLLFNCASDPVSSPDSADASDSAIARVRGLAATPSIMCPLLALVSGSPSAAEWAGLLTLRIVETGHLRELALSAAAGLPLWSFSNVVGVAEATSTRSVSVGEELPEKPTFAPASFLRPLCHQVTAELVVLLHLLEACDAAPWLARAGSSPGAASDFAGLVDLLVALCIDAMTASAASSTGLGPEGEHAQSRARLALPALLSAASVLADALADAVVSHDSGPDLHPGSAASASSTGDDGLRAAAEVRAAISVALPSVLALMHGLTPLPSPQSADQRAASASARAAAAATAGIGSGESYGGEEAMVARVALSPGISQSATPAGLRSALCRLVALTSFRDPRVAAVVLGAGGGTGVRVVLSQCAMDAANPTLREWGLLAVRNLCEALPGPGGVPAEVERLKAAGVTAAPELGALGVRGSSHASD